MPQIYRPAAEWELVSVIADAAINRTRLEITGGGTKRKVGRPFVADAELSTRSLRGISLYEPTELVMRARAGTPLADVEAELAKAGQMLAFEPIDLGPALGAEAGGATIGGVFASNLSGARRIVRGAARDHLLGLRGINGRGEIFKSGGRVMKNVTGLDVARALTGSWGTLAVITEVTFKVLPAPEDTLTLVLYGLSDGVAAEVLCQAMGTPFEVSGAIHLQAAAANRLWHKSLRSPGRSVTALRLEGFAASNFARAQKLKDELAPYGAIHMLDQANAIPLWKELNQLSVMQASVAKPLWRLSVAPKSGPKVVAMIERYMPVEAFYDWSGGLVWLMVDETADAGATDIRRVIATFGGHATLIRAGGEVRSEVEVFHPLDPAVQRITEGIKLSFDPSRILNPGRMYADL